MSYIFFSLRNGENFWASVPIVHPIGQFVSIHRFLFPFFCLEMGPITDDQLAAWTVTFLGFRKRPAFTCTRHLVFTGRGPNRPTSAFNGRKCGDWNLAFPSPCLTFRRTTHLPSLLSENRLMVGRSPMKFIWPGNPISFITFHASIFQVRIHENSFQLIIETRPSPNALIWERDTKRGNRTEPRSTWKKP